jgi:hypothetical protein
MVPQVNIGILVRLKGDVDIITRLGLGQGKKGRQAKEGNYFLHGRKHKIYSK